MKHAGSGDTWSRTTAPIGLSGLTDLLLYEVDAARFWDHWRVGHDKVPQAIHDASDQQAARDAAAGPRSTSPAKKTTTDLGCWNSAQLTAVAHGKTWRWRWRWRLPRCYARQPERRRLQTGEQTIW
jgi:hypothetical protein